MLISNVANADELRERANAIFKPIPATVAEVRGTAVSSVRVPQRLTAT